MTLRRVLVASIGVAGIALFAASLRTLGLERVFDGVRRVGWGFIAILLVSGAREAARTLAWIRTVEGPARLPFARAFGARLAGEALNTLLPMGMLVGEPVKASHVWPHLPFGAAFSALLVEFAFYGLSLALLLAVGAGALVIGARMSPSPQAMTMAGIALVALLAVAYAGRARIIRSTRRPLAVLRGFAAAHPEHVRAILAFELAYQVLAVAEVYMTLRLVSPVPPTLASSLVLETVSRTITMVFKMLPMRVGVDEASSSLFAGHLDLGAATGVTLALVRKLRLLFWSAVGLAFLLARRWDASASPALSWPRAGEQVSLR